MSRTWGALFDYNHNILDSYEGCQMLDPGYHHNTNLCVDINPRKGTAYVWYLDGTDRIDFEPIKLGQSMELIGERKYKRRNMERSLPWDYEW